MWLMPHSWIAASVVSARSWLIPPSAAAPKIARVDWWPVRPKGAVGIMSRPYDPRALRLGGADRAHIDRDGRLLHGVVAGDEVPSSQLAQLGLVGGADVGGGGTTG